MIPGPSAAHDCFEVHVTTPYDPEWVFGFLAKRALAALEYVDGSTYARRVSDAEWLVVRWQDGTLEVTVPPSSGLTRQAVHRRVARLFDCACDGAAVATSLAQQPRLATLLSAAPGLRVPGAWDGFETAVRAILGQQVSVARATVLANALVERYGAGQFPTPAALAAATPAELGMPGLRGQAISSLAQQVAQGSLHLDGQPQELRAELLQIPGIGPWTAEYVAMRVARDADAFVATDWVVRKQLGLTPAAARRWAEPMRPWRAYAVMYLWWAAAAGVTC